MAGERILVVDDDPKILAVLEKMLGDAGYEIRCTADPKEALKLTGQVKPHLVILDIAMPDLDGFEVAARIRSDTALSKTPLMFLTARDATPNLTKARELRAEAYVEKPFQKEALLGLLEQVLSRPK